MARPTTYGARTTTAIRFPEDLHKELRAAADERDLSLNDLVVRLCEYGLPRLRPVDSRMFVDDEPAGRDT